MIAPASICSSNNLQTIGQTSNGYMTFHAVMKTLVSKTRGASRGLLTLLQRLAQSGEEVDLDVERRGRLGHTDHISVKGIEHDSGIGRAKRRDLVAVVVAADG